MEESEKLYQNMQGFWNESICPRKNKKLINSSKSIKFVV